LRVELACSVRRADQWSGEHAGEADPGGELLVFDELVGVHPPFDGVVTRRGAQVLGDGDDVAARVVQVA